MKILRNFSINIYTNTMYSQYDIFFPEKFWHLGEIGLCL